MCATAVQTVIAIAHEERADMSISTQVCFKPYIEALCTDCALLQCAQSAAHLDMHGVVHMFACSLSCFPVGVVHIQHISQFRGIVM